ncbi:hypothetical protein AYI70_g5319 [Smittium culicis]|uniref:SH3 domain-containing protein n=1 Tax=Smittium culicis TaxID=133412 RepID=A0A1R1XV42_9FUNG|nr:hypothetical protein AYI70_g5319 [Smittium culicis]
MEDKNKDNEEKLKSLLSLLGKKQKENYSDTTQNTDSANTSTEYPIQTEKKAGGGLNQNSIPSTTQTDIVVNQSGITVSIVERVIPVILPTEKANKIATDSVNGFFTNLPTVTVSQTQLITVQTNLQTTSPNILTNSYSIDSNDQNRANSSSKEGISTGIIIIIASFSLVIILLVIWMLIYVTKKSKNKPKRIKKYEDSYEDDLYQDKGGYRSSRFDGFQNRNNRMRDMREQENYLYHNRFNDYHIEPIAINPGYSAAREKFVNRWPKYNDEYNNVYNTPDIEMYGYKRPKTMMMANAYSAPPNIRIPVVENKSYLDLDTTSELLGEVRGIDGNRLKNNKLATKLLEQKKQNQQLKNKLLAKKLASQQKLETKLYNELLQDSINSQITNENTSSTVRHERREIKKPSLPTISSAVNEESVYLDQKQNKGIMGLVSEMVKRQVDGIWGNVKENDKEHTDNNDRKLNRNKPSANLDRDREYPSSDDNLSEKYHKNFKKTEYRVSDYFKRFKKNSNSENSNKINKKSIKHLSNTKINSSFSDSYIEKIRNRQKLSDINKTSSKKYKGKSFREKNDNRITQKYSSEIEDKNPGIISRSLSSVSIIQLHKNIKKSENYPNTFKKRNITMLSKNSTDSEDYHQNSRNKSEFYESKDSLAQKYDFTIRHDPPLGPLKAVEGHEPLLSDELTIQKGDEIFVIGEFSDGWILAVIYTKGSPEGIMGMIPRRCVFLSSTPFNSNQNISS